MRNSVDQYLVNSLFNSLGNLLGLCMPKYKYPDVESFFEKRVVIFGARRVGQYYYLQINMQSRCHNMALVDTNYNACNLPALKFAINIIFKEKMIVCRNVVDFTLNIFIIGEAEATDIDSQTDFDFAEFVY